MNAPAAPDLLPSQLLRRLGGAARWLQLLSRLLLGGATHDHEDFQLRCLTFALLAGFLSCGGFGVLQFAAGETTQAAMLGAIALLFAGVVLLFRWRPQAAFGLNAVVTVSFVGITLMMVLQGGIYTPTAWWLISLPYLLATTGLHRSAVAWLGLSALDILVFAALDAHGIGPPLDIGAAPRVFIVLSHVSLFAILISFALILSAARMDNARRAAAAYQQVLAASAAKSRFLATMSHEIRTPLNGVIGAAELLRAKSPSPEQAALIATMQHSGEHLKSLIDDILDFSRIEAGMLELENAVLDPSELLHRTVDSLGIIARDKGLTCECRMAPDMPKRVRGDAARLRQIAHNLIGNAIKFTAAGRVEVEGTVVPADTPGRLRLQLIVRDTGVGIAPEKLPRLFKAFSQADDSTTRLFGGSGLGLAISQELARRMHGEIRVESVPDQGTTFTCVVELGIVEGASDATCDAASSETPQASGPALVVDAVGGSRVLLVEDNLVNLALGTAMLEQLGCAVDTAENGRLGVERWRAGAYDLVLLDCHMPVMDGLAAAREMRGAEDAGTHTPIVALTASAFAEDRAACLAAGMDDFLSKPYTFNQLREIVTRHARRPSEMGTDLFFQK